MEPLISIVTVSFNSEKTIRQTIESVLNQTYTNIEYNIVDGASTDKTVEIATQYKDDFEAKGIKYIITSEKDKGIYDAMNKGMDRATGSWIIFMNAGDTFCDNEVIKNIFGYNDLSDYSVIYGDCYVSKLNQLQYLKASNMK